MSSEMAGLSKSDCFTSLFQELLAAVLPFQQFVGPFIDTHHVAVALHETECKDKQVDFTGISDTNYRVASE